MVHESLCAFCRHLPVLTKHCSGKLSHCPLCKSTLWETGEGATYRIPCDDDNENLQVQDQQHHWWNRLAGMVSLW